MATNNSSVVDEFGNFDDWIEIYNTTSDTIDLDGYYITDDIYNLIKHRFEGAKGELKMAPTSYCLLWADDSPEQGVCHLSFKLDGEGEEIYLLDTAGYLHHSVIFPVQRNKISMGQAPDTNNLWVYFDIPTPGYKNSSQYYHGICHPPQFSVSGGIFVTDQQVSIASSENDTIFYTLNNSLPDSNSIPYQGVLTFSSDTTIRAIAYHDGYLPSDVISHTYLFNKEYTLPVIAVISDSSNFWGDSGIYSNPLEEGEEWERFCQVQFMVNGELRSEINAGIRIQGGNSVGMPKKSFRLFFNEKYGDDRLEYPVFGPNTITSFKNLVLKSGYDDDISTGTGTLLRDALSAEYWRNISTLSTQSSWAMLYLNHSFWGIYNVRESINEFFIHDHTGLQDFDLIRYDREGPVLKYGSWNDWDELTRLFDTLDFTNPCTYNTLSGYMSMDDFVNLMAFVNCAQYKSWGWGISAYKENSVSGRWRYTIWDTDRAYTDVSWNAFSTAQDTIGLRWANRFLFKWLQNDIFNEKLITRICDLLNTQFVPENAIPVLNALYNTIKADIPEEIQRWNPANTYWEQNVQSIRDFLTNRPGILRNQVQSWFSLTPIKDLQLRIAGKGYIQVNTITADHFPWKGKYFSEFEIVLQAIPRPGYKFIGWQNLDATGDSISFILVHDTIVTAMFEPDPTIESKQIIINEICYQPPAEYPSDDWIELYNPNPFPVDISGWILKDEADNSQFLIPSNTTLISDQYLVVAKDVLDFRDAIPWVGNITGSFEDGASGFGLSGSMDIVRLYNSEGEIIDSVPYQNGYPWPWIAPDAGGSIQLCNPYSDHSTPSNWKYIFDPIHTPGTCNSCYTDPLPVPLQSSPNPFISLNYPNPFSHLTTIPVYLESSQYLEIVILNMNMQMIKALAKGYFQHGRYEFTWDGTNAGGTKMPPGIYFYTLKMPDYNSTQKMILMY